MHGLILMQAIANKGIKVNNDRYDFAPTQDESLDGYDVIIHDLYKTIRMLTEERDTYLMRRDYLSEKLAEKVRDLGDAWSLIRALKKDLGEL